MLTCRHCLVVIHRISTLLDGAYLSVANRDVFADSSEPETFPEHNTQSWVFRFRMIVRDHQCDWKFTPAFKFQKFLLIRKAEIRITLQYVGNITSTEATVAKRPIDLSPAPKVSEFFWIEKPDRQCQARFWQKGRMARSNLRIVY